MAEIVARKSGVPVIVEMDRTSNMALYRDGFMSGTQELFVTVKCDLASKKKGYSNSWDSKKKKGEQNPVWKDEATIFILPNELFAKVSRKFSFSFTIVDRGTMTNTPIHQTRLTIRSDGSATVGGSRSQRTVPADGNKNYHRLWSLPLTPTQRGNAKPGGELHVYVDCSAVFGERDYIRKQKAKRRKSHHHARRLSRVDVMTPRQSSIPGMVPRQGSRACMTDTTELPGLPRITGVPAIPEEQKQNQAMPSTPLVRASSLASHVSWRSLNKQRSTLAIPLDQRGTQVLPARRLLGGSSDSRDMSPQSVQSSLSKAVGINDTPTSGYPELFPRVETPLE